MKGMSSSDMDLIQHDTTESARLNVILRYKSSDAWRNLRHRIIASITWSQLRRSPAHFSFCTCPTSTLPHQTHKHSSNNMYKNNNHRPHSLPKCSSRPDVQLLWSAHRGTQHSGIHCKLSLHRQHRVVMQGESSLEPLAENHCWRCVGAWHFSPPPDPELCMDLTSTLRMWELWSNISLGRHATPALPPCSSRASFHFRPGQGGNWNGSLWNNGTTPSKCNGCWFFHHLQQRHYPENNTWNKTKWLEAGS